MGSMRVAGLVLLLVLAVSTADAQPKIRRKRKSPPRPPPSPVPPPPPPPPPPPTVYSLLGGLPTYSVLKAAIDSLGVELSGPLHAPGAYTVFAPADVSFVQKLTNISAHPYLYCSNQTVTVRCTSAAQLLATPYTLKTLLLNHVIVGEYDMSTMAAGTPLGAMGGNTITINHITRNVTANNVTTPTTFTMAGNVTILNPTAPIKVANGLVYLVSDVLVMDNSFNASSVRVMLETIADISPETVNMTGFTDTHINGMMNAMQQNIFLFRNQRSVVANPDGGYLYPMPMNFDSTMGYSPCTLEPIEHWTDVPQLTPPVALPSDEDLAFMSVHELGALIKAKRVSSMYLTQLSLNRMKQYDFLECVVTVTETLALEQAKAADDLLAQGTYLGPLQGVPYGLKDLISVPPYRTTWGSGAFIDQVIPFEANIYKLLRSAGAVLVAKLATGEMATGDRWWGGKARNPWNIASGASGSSAGPGSAVAAGLVWFAIGSETSGSIISPAIRNGIFGLRPTSALIGRSWTMALSQSCDKLGPMTRTAADAALVLNVVRGKDADDAGSCNVTMASPFSINATSLKIAYINNSLDASLLTKLRAMGFSLTPITMRWTVNSGGAGSDATNIVSTALRVETAAYFDTWMRSGAMMQNANLDGWPASLRVARTISAVDYVQAMRARSIVAMEFNAQMKNFDIVLCNQSGIPSLNSNANNVPDLVLPVRFDAPTIPSFLNPTNYPWVNYTTTPRKQAVMLRAMAAPFKEPQLLAFAMAYQAMDPEAIHKMRPPIDKVEPQIMANCTRFDDQPFAMRCQRPAHILLKLNETGVGLPMVNIRKLVGM